MNKEPIQPSSPETSSQVPPRRRRRPKRKKIIPEETPQSQTPPQPKTYGPVWHAWDGDDFGDGF